MEKNLRVEQIPYEMTKPFLLNIHYARRIPCIQYAFGLYDGAFLIGVVTYGQPASPSLCVGLAGVENKKNVLELNRLVILPSYNGTNCASYLVGNSLKRLPHRTFVISYADWGGVATRWICVPKYEFPLYRNDQASYRQILKWSFPTLRKR